MTKKIVHWWAKMSFWNKFRTICLGIGAGSEFALIIGESSEVYKWLVGGATLLALLIPHLFEDKNKNGVVDIFENGKK